MENIEIKKKHLNDQRTLATRVLMMVGDNWFGRARLCDKMKVSMQEGEEIIKSLSSTVFLAYSIQNKVDQFKVILDDKKRVKYIKTEKERIQNKLTQQIKYYDELIELINSREDKELVN